MRQIINLHTLTSILAVLMFSIEAKSQDTRVIENALTLELSFGDDNLPDKYLLARPLGIAVNNDGDIFVIDEAMVKVYDSSGKAKMTIGRSGQGPGEFQRILNLYLSNSGFLSVLSRDLYSIFDTQYEYVDAIGRKLYDYDEFKSKHNLNLIYQSSTLRSPPMVALDTNERILYFFGGPDPSKLFTMDEFLLYDKDGEITLLAEYKNVSFQQNRYDRNSAFNHYHFGIIRYGFLPNNKIVYTHTHHDKEITGEENYYILNIKSLETFEKNIIKQKYTPVRIEEDYIERQEERILSRGDAKTTPIGNNLRKIKYWATNHRMIIDDFVGYVFTMQQNDKEEYLVDVFDFEAEKYLRSVYFPSWTKDHNYTIKGGYIYWVNASPNEFAKIEKYKIDPGVYRKN